jgi:hypothetical protein
MNSKLDSNLVFSDWKGKLNIYFLGNVEDMGLFCAKSRYYFPLLWAFWPYEWEKNYGAFDRAKKVVFYDYVT